MANPPTDPLLSIAQDYKNQIAPDADDYQLVYNLSEKINDESIQIFRFEPNGTSGQINLHHAHITIIINKKGELKGFSYLSGKMKGANKLSEDKSQQLALSFLNKYATDLINSTFQYINNQDFLYIDTAGKTTLNAKWVKYRDQAGHYLWVMLAPDGTVMEFDRDIVWSFFRGGRVNELWLRDDWFGKRIDKK